MNKPTLLYDDNFFNLNWRNFFKDFNCHNILPDNNSTALIRWGNTTGPDNRNCTLNRKRALANSLDPETTFKIFKLNRIRRPNIITPNSNTPYPVIAKTSPTNQYPGQSKVVKSYEELSNIQADYFFQYIPTLKDYRAWVFDAKVFHLEKKIAVKTNTLTKLFSPQKFYESIPTNLDADTERICQLAIKATHILGLDFSLVRLGIDKRNRPIVLDIKPVLKNIDKGAHKFLEQLKQVFTKITEKKMNPKILMGADPEFIIKNQLTGGLVYPSSFINKEGLFGYDERSERREGKLFPLAEIRPTPDTCPINLTKKIGTAMQNGLSKIPYSNLEWLAGSVHFGRYQIGGHIHYSGLELSSQLLRALDNYLAIPIMLIEETEAAAKRRKAYGGLGNIRLKPHGFEYRTLGSWIISPEITRAVLCLAKVVVEEFENLKLDLFKSFPLQKAFYECSKTKFYKLFPALWKDIQNTDTYHQYENELQLIPEMVLNHQTWDETTDIRKTWHLIIPDNIFKAD